MQRIKWALLALLVVLTALWLLAEPLVFQSANFFALRGALVQYSGIVAIGCMSVAMMLAVRPRWPEKWFGGLDKMYRLHKWLGIGALVFAVGHWLWAQGPKWAVGWGLLERPQRGGHTREASTSFVEQTLSSLRHPAEGIGEWAFYVAALFMLLALIKYFPYRQFFKTHTVLALTYLVLVFHAIVLMKFSYWTTPVGVVVALLLAGGTVSAFITLFGRIGAGRKVQGKIAALQYYPDVRTLEVEVDVPQGWKGHSAGQFAFATSDPSEGPHPYTIASAWNDGDRKITFIIKELGDHTGRLHDKLKIGQDLTIEGPYGRFTFDDKCPQQIWVGGGIGITPFIARMKELAAMKDRPEQTIDLFHTTADYDADAIAKLKADAQAAGVRLHVLIDSKDGLLSGERIRQTVAQWRDASIWFCGPTGFAKTLHRDFATEGAPVSKRFHRELFAMR